MPDFMIYPAIDVRDGRVVRLRQGDYAQETRYPADPFELASQYARAGAAWLHLDNQRRGEVDTRPGLFAFSIAGGALQ